MISFYLLVDGPRIRERSPALIPGQHRAKAAGVAHGPIRKWLKLTFPDPAVVADAGGGPVDLLMAWGSRCPGRPSPLRGSAMPSCGAS